MKDKLLMELLNCGYRDLERLLYLLEIAEKFDITVSDIVDLAKNSGSEINLNTLIFFTMDRIMEELAKHSGCIKGKRLYEDFNPHINYFDSWFNNIVDEFIWDCKDKSKYEIIDTFKTKLKETK